MDGWRLLGYESLEEWLGDPAVGLTRTHFFRLTGLWRELVVERVVPHAGLRGVDMDKLDTALPAVKRGEVEPDEAIADAHALSRSDLQQKYQPSADNAYYCQTHAPLPSLVIHCVIGCSRRARPRLKLDGLTA